MSREQDLFDYADNLMDTASEGIGRCEQVGDEKFIIKPKEWVPLYKSLRGAGKVIRAITYKLVALQEENARLRQRLTESDR